MKMKMKMMIASLFVTVASFAIMSPVLAAVGDFMTPPPASTFDVTTSFTSPSGSNSYVDSTRSNVVVITDNKPDQFGAIWSNGRMDMTKPFVYESFLYWGRSQSDPLGSYAGVNGGDGMTFTLQNDPAGTQAYGGLGGALGVYSRAGVSAVNNALSFELDAYINSEFDQDLTPTIGNPDSDRHTAFVTPTSAMGLGSHTDLKMFDDYGNLVDEWVTFRAVWTPVGAGGTLSVTINNITSTYNVANTATQFGGTFAHLGFTGATGGLTALQAVAVTELPVFSYNLSFNLGYLIPPAITPPTQVEVGNAPVMSLPTPGPRLGYSFDGWYDTNGTLWVEGSTLMPPRYVTLTARWTPIKVDLNFDLNGQPDATPQPLTQQVTFGTNEAVEPVPAPTVAGYNFVGWSTTPDANNPWDFTNDLMPATPVTLYAIWDIAEFTLSFDLNGGTSDLPINQILLYNTLANLPETPYKEGFTFTGWNTDVSGAGTNWDFASTTMPANDVVLYAQWTVNSYNMSFDLNGGTSPVPDVQSIDFNALGMLPDTPYKEGHTFTSWNTDVNGNGADWDFASTTMPANDVVLYAQWSINSYNIDFDLNGGTSANPEMQTVVFNELASSPQVPFKEGYTFTAWNTDVNGNGTDWDFATTVMPANDVVLYAQWTVNSYDMSFDLNGGTSVVPDIQTVVFNELAVLPETPLKEGYTFTGWNTDMNGAVANWDFATTTMPANDVVLYAQWTINSYNLSFDNNGGDGLNPDTQVVQFNSGATEPTLPTKHEHTFLGWNTSMDGSGDTWSFVDPQTMMPSNDVVLYAQWAINTYSLVFDLNGAPGVAPDTQIVIYNDSTIAPVDPQYDGYTFTGWNTSKDGSGIAWNFDEMLMPGNDVTLYAQWTKLIDADLPATGYDSSFINVVILSTVVGSALLISRKRKIV